MSLSEWSNSIRGNSHHHDDDDNDDEEDDESEKGILAPRMGHGYTQSSPSPKGPIGLGYSYQTPCRRSVGSSSSPKCSSCGSVRSSDDFLLHDDRPSPGLELPSRLFSTPSAASSLGLASAIMSPLRRELSRSRLHDNESGRPQSVPPSPGLAKITLARRLSQLAQQLTEGDDVDESALTTQVDQLEKAMRSPSPPRKAFQTPQRAHRSFSPRASHGGGGGDHHHHHRAPSSLHSTPASSLHRSRLSDFSASLMAKVREAEAEPEPTTTQQQLAKPAMNIEEANQVIAEASKLNEELTRVVGNLRARQEESDHIQELLIERAERAAQRILFLQNRISNLEYELKENDDEVQHLRICLKAVEIQLPSRSRLDPELQRCLTTFKKDYKDLKTKRAANRMSTSSLDGVHLDIMSSPLR